MKHDDDDPCRFAAQGYSILRGLFPPELAHRVLAEDVSWHLNATIRAVNQLRGFPVPEAELDQLLVTDITRRLARAEATPGLEQVGVTAHKTAWCGPAARAIVRHPRVLAAVRALLTSITDGDGGVVAMHPSYDLRCKPPVASGDGRPDPGTVPWHQDAAYVASPGHVANHLSRGDGSQTSLRCELCASPQLTLWVPLVDLTGLGREEEAAAGALVDGSCSAHSNPGALAGPLSVLPGRWLTPGGCGTLLPHIGCEPGTWYLHIAPAALQQMIAERGDTVDAVVREISTLGPGDAVVFHSFTPHRALPNLLSRTQATRWTIDARYQWAGRYTGCDVPALPLEGADPVAWEKLPCCRPVDCVAEALADGTAGAGPSFLLPHIGGPWMDAWPMVTPSPHLAAYRAGLVRFPEVRYAEAPGGEEPLASSLEAVTRP